MIFIFRVEGEEDTNEILKNSLFGRSLKGKQIKLPNEVVG